MEYVAHFDGACMPRNPGGYGGWGYVIDGVDALTVELAQGCGVLPAGPGMTCNVAEYTAALECLRGFAALELGKVVVVRGDSQLVIGQMSGQRKAKSGAYLPVYRETLEFVQAHRLEVRWEWIERSFNGRADALSRTKLAGLPWPPSSNETRAQGSASKSKDQVISSTRSRP